MTPRNKPPHPIIGTLISAYFLGGYRLGLVSKMRFPTRSPPEVVVRMYTPPPSRTPPLPPGSWALIEDRYRGHLAHVPITRIIKVLAPPPNDVWVDATHFLEVAEQDR